MQAKWISQNPRTLAVVFDRGDELVSGLNQVAGEFRLAGSHFTGIGTCRELTVGFFNRQSREYQRCIFREQMEMLSLVGDIAEGGQGPVVHAHVVAGRADFTTHGGHLLHGLVWPTLEIIIVESPRHLRRVFNPELNLALIALS
jgi:predicted DNA-binding protein with PD1-like motif